MKRERACAYATAGSFWGHATEVILTWSTFGTCQTLGTHAWRPRCVMGRASFVMVYSPPENA